MILVDLIIWGAVAVAMAIEALAISFQNKKLAFVIWGLSTFTFFVMAYTL